MRKIHSLPDVVQKLGGTTTVGSLYRGGNDGHPYAGSEGHTTLSFFV